MRFCRICLYVCRICDIPEKAPQWAGEADHWVRDTFNMEQRHVYDEEIVIEPTDEEEGLKKLVCRFCGDEQLEIIAGQE